jgi:pilus assembly protein CpaF
MSKALKDKVKQRIISQYSGMFLSDKFDLQVLKDRIFTIASDIIIHEYANLSFSEREKVINELVDELTGFGPLESLMNDPQVTEIMINGPKKVYVEKAGKTMLTDITFDDDNQVMHIVNKMLVHTHRHVDESLPYADFSLQDGSRVNVIIPPLAVDGPMVTIRKFLKEIKSVEDLVRLGTLDERMGDFLVASIKAKANIIFSGATGCGKTTSIGVFSSYIANDERIVTIEDTAELHLSQEHVVRLESRQANIERRGEVTIRHLFRNSLRMRPDRIILGEIRGSEALDMLQANCSGHKGSLAVLHASSPQDAIYRLETMILTSGVPISLDAIHRQIFAAVNLIVEQEQLVDGTRKITYITQVNGLKDGRVVLEDIFLYDQKGLDQRGLVIGKWLATGAKPVFYNLFTKAGINLSEEIFNKD